MTSLERENIMEVPCSLHEEVTFVEGVVSWEGLHNVGGKGVVLYTYGIWWLMAKDSPQLVYKLHTIFDKLTTYNFFFFFQTLKKCQQFWSVCRLGGLKPPAHNMWVVSTTYRATKSLNYLHASYVSYVLGSPRDWTGEDTYSASVTPILHYNIDFWHFEVRCRQLLWNCISYRVMWCWDQLTCSTWPSSFILAIGCSISIWFHL